MLAYHCISQACNLFARSTDAEKSCSRTDHILDLGDLDDEI